jgi:imidazole glycerol-phosphate synthase subunit HisH
MQGCLPESSEKGNAMDIAVVDYGLGNSGSVLNMLSHLGIQAVLSGDLKTINRAKRLIIPGVGSYDSAMQNIRGMQLYDLLMEKATIQKIPILGICLGMQLLTASSDEGVALGFGLIKGKTRKMMFPDNPLIKVPHMGWNRIHCAADHPVVQGIGEEDRFYFVHSYFVESEDPGIAVAETEYHIRFNSVIASENLIGCQFHPEKSHRSGMKLLKNFNNL